MNSNTDIKELEKLLSGMLIKSGFESFVIEHIPAILIITATIDDKTKTISPLINRDDSVEDNAKSIHERILREFDKWSGMSIKKAIKKNLEGKGYSCVTVGKVAMTSICDLDKAIITAVKDGTFAKAVIPHIERADGPKHVEWFVGLFEKEYEEARILAMTAKPISKAEKPGLGLTVTIIDNAIDSLIKQKHWRCALLSKIDTCSCNDLRAIGFYVCREDSKEGDINLLIAKDGVSARNAFSVNYDHSSEQNVSDLRDAIVKVWEGNAEETREWQEAEEFKKENERYGFFVGVASQARACIKMLGFSSCSYKIDEENAIRFVAFKNGFTVSSKVYVCQSNSKEHNVEVCVHSIVSSWVRELKEKIMDSSTGMTNESTINNLNCDCEAGNSCMKLGIPYDPSIGIA